MGTDLPQGTQLGCESTRPEAMCSDSHFRVSSKTLFIISSFLARAALGGSKFLVTSPPHGSVLGTNWILTVLPMVAECHVRQDIFHNKKETEIASDLICNFPIAAGI